MAMDTAEASSKRIMLLLLSTLSFLAFTTALFCPQPEDVYPCRCLTRFTMQMSHTMLFCGGHNVAMSQVQTAFKAMVKKVSIISVKFKDLHMGNLNVSLFDNISIFELQFEDCSIEGFIATERKPLPNPPYTYSIYTLEITNSIHGDVEINLVEFVNMTHLILSNNVIKNLEIIWPDMDIGLTSMSLINNSIESVDGDSLAPLSALDTLDMSMNRLRNLGKELKPNDAGKLSRLDFSRNRISSISKYYFQKMPSLKYVVLSHNQIQMLSERTWKLVWSQLSYINLGENPLNCGKEIKWIQGPQPETVRGTCSTPDSKKSKNLKDVIKENNATGSYLPETLI